MANSKPAWHDYIWRIRPERMSIIILFVTALPLFVSLGIPLPASYLSTDYYNTVISQAAKATAEGRRPVMVKGEIMYAVTPGFKDSEASQVLLFTRYNYKMLFVTMDTTSHVNVLDMMKRYKYAYQIPGEKDIIGGPYVYGVDWVLTPSILGEEPAMARVAANIWEACNNKDFFGTPFDQLPMMATLHSFNDVDVTRGAYYSGTHVEMFIRQWTNAIYPNIRAVGGYAYEDVAYAYGRYIYGTLSTMRGAAEFEQLVNFKGSFGRPGEDQAKIESRNTQAITMFAFIALGAIHLNIEKRRRAPAIAEVKKEA